MPHSVEEPILPGEAAESPHAQELNKHLTSTLVEAGRRLGFEVRTEFPLRGARVDVVWLWHPALPIPGVEGSLPVAGFEVESGWRTRKHVKGDLLNLQDLGAALGVIVLAGSGKKVHELRAFARALTARPGPLVLIWSEQEVEALGASAATSVSTSQWATAGGDSSIGEPREHRGKYAALWRWLRAHKADNVSATFTEVEQILGFDLPASCRKYEAHWYGYDGSAVARAIRDAGWRATEVNLTSQSVVFVRLSR